MPVEVGRRRLLVTVGSTKFDALIKEILSDPMIKLFKAAGFPEWRVQYGASPLPAIKADSDIQLFDYKESLQEDIEWADLVIGHAGSGTVLDVLRGPIDKVDDDSRMQSRRPMLIIVVNQQLMDNHQLELADTLAQSNICMSCQVNELMNCIKEVLKAESKMPFKPLPLPKTDALDKVILELLH